ncbi:hypothetical protein ACF0H5_000545 [Mactra antiquata]
MSDSQMGGDSVHDSDSMLGSPAHSSTSDDPFSTPSKLRIPNVESPLVHDSSREFSDMDTTLKTAADVILPTYQSPFSMHRFTDVSHERHLSTRFNFMPTSSPTSACSRSSGLNRSYSIESLAKSSVTSDTREKEPGDHNKSFDYTLSPLSSPGDFSHQNSPKFGMSTFAEDINKNLSPKKQTSGLSNNFSISTLSVSAVTPSRVHCS